jgi:hypothetical protein
MTARDALGGHAPAIFGRLEEVLDSEDAVIVLMDRRGATSFYHGFGASGCQLELFGHLLDTVLSGIAVEGHRTAVPAGREEGRTASCTQ